MARELQETQLLKPVLRLFPRRRYRRFVEVPLGRKRIDLLCVERGDTITAAAVELKIDDWRKALWQATLDLQIAEKAYIALWHEFVHRAERQANLLRDYGVGLISVCERSAEKVFESKDQVVRIARNCKPDFYKLLLSQV